MEKKETKKHAHKITELDRKHKQGTASTRAKRIDNCPKKGDVDRRLTTTIRVRKWKRLPPGRNLVNNLAKNRACNERVTQKEEKNRPKVITRKPKPENGGN